ncbi:MAG: hypothetical protein HOM58_10035 [Rhodospirillaceae bacterium]|jgi:hypothetical protein|nr:hypothetical protein [Rhodospirillaceae bacterium]
MAPLKFRQFGPVVGAFLAAFTSLFPAGSTPAQAANPPAGMAKESAPPRAILDRALAGKRGMPAIDHYLRGDGAGPEIVVRRATALIRALGRNRRTMRPLDLLAAVDTVTHVAARSLSYATVMHLAIEQGYRPDKAVLAWDFGPVEGNAMPGFRRIAPDDHRLSGTGIAALRRSDENALLTDGIAGLRKINLDLPDGEYRIILMTQNFGVPSLVRNPFGREIRINGIPLIVMRHGPSTWLSHALLARDNVRSARGGVSNVRGYPVGDVRAEVAALLPAQQGGAIVVEGTSIGGKISIELAGFNKTQSYLTGLIVERLKEPSDLVLSDSARSLIIPLELRLALETEILLVAAEIVQGIAPAAGLAIPGDDVVTPN